MQPHILAAGSSARTAMYLREHLHVMAGLLHQSPPQQELTKGRYILSAGVMS